MKFSYILIAMTLLSPAASAKKASCEHAASALANDLGTSSLEIVLPITDTLAAKSEYGINSSAELASLIQKAGVLKKYTERKSLLIKNPALIYFNIDKRCTNFESLFNDRYMSQVMDFEFEEYIGFNAPQDFMNFQMLKIAFQNSDISETPYFKFKNYDDVIAYINASADKIINNQSDIKKSITEQYSLKSEAIEKERQKAIKLKEDINKEEALAKKLKLMQEENERLAQELADKKIKRQSITYSSKTNAANSNVAYSVNGDIDISKAKLDTAVLLIRATGYKCEEVNSALYVSYNGSYAINCNEWRYAYKIVDEGGNWKAYLD